MMITRFKAPTVAPHTGAWIETSKNPQDAFPVASLPIRERGLELETSKAKGLTPTIYRNQTSVPL